MRTRAFDRTFIPKYIVTVSLFLILSVAFWIRYKGITFGFPILTHPDEAVIANAIVRMLDTGDFNPHNFLYPSLYFYIQYIVLLIADSLYSLLDIPLTATSYYFWGRLLTVLFSVGTIYLTYVIGSRLFNQITGFVAALISSVSFLHVENSFMITTDSPMAFWVIVSFFVCVFCFIDKPKLWYYLVASMTIGFAIGTKYTAVWCVLPMLVVHFYHHSFTLSSIFNKKLWIALLLVPVFFLITTPYIIIDFDTFYHYIEFQKKAYANGWKGFESSTDISFSLYCTALVLKYGVIPLLLAGIGILWLLLKERWKGLLLACFPSTYFFFFAFHKTFFDRNLVVLIPFLALSSGFGVTLLYDLCNKIASMKWKMIMLAFVFVLLGFGIVDQFSQDLAHVNKITLPNTRWTSKLWLDANIPRQSKIATEFYTPHPDRTKFVVVNYGVCGLLKADLKKFDYFIASSRDYGRFFNKKKQYPKETAMYHDLFNQHILIKEFVPDNKTSSGPVIKIFMVQKEHD